MWPAPLPSARSLRRRTRPGWSTFGALSIPSYVAFDQSGDLWVTDETNWTLEEFAPGALTSSGMAEPTLVIPVNEPPGAITFDGDVLLVAAGNGTILMYGPEDLGPTATTSRTRRSPPPASVWWFRWPSTPVVPTYGCWARTALSPPTTCGRPAPRTAT